ncbi:MAG: methyltransferase domain-containing protein [Planctomycetota bacterium]
MTIPRVRVLELMDDPDLPRSDHLRALNGLKRLNAISGVATQLFSHLLTFACKDPGRPLRVLDVASGGGDLPIRWALMAKRRSVAMEFTCVDISPIAVEQQQENAAKHGVALHGMRRDCLKQGLPEGYDVATCSLFMHHLDEAQAARLLQSMQMAANGLLICDLDRSRCNLAAVWAASRVLTRSHVVHHDATASVRAAFTRAEFTELANRALARPVRCHRLLPARFVMRVDEVAVEELSPAFA